MTFVLIVLACVQGSRVIAIIRGSDAHRASWFGLALTHSHRDPPGNDDQVVAIQGEEPDLEQQAHALRRLSVLFLEALKSKGEDLAKSGIMEARPWLEGIARTLVAALLKYLEELRPRVQVGSKKLQANQLPSLDKEGEYRKEGVKIVGMLAQLSSSTEQDLKKLRDARSALTALHSVRFSLGGDTPFQAEFAAKKANLKQDPLNPSKEEQDADGLARVAAFHVAAIAALCLVRGDAVKQADAKLKKQIREVSCTLQSKCDGLPAHSSALIKAGEALVTECQKIGGVPETLGSRLKGRKGKTESAEEGLGADVQKKPRTASQADVSEANASKQEVKTEDAQLSGDNAAKEATKDTKIQEPKQEVEGEQGGLKDKDAKEKKDNKEKKHKKEKKDKEKKDKEKKDKKEPTEKKDQKNKKDKKNKKNKKDKKDKNTEQETTQETQEKQKKEKGEDKSKKEKKRKDPKTPEEQSQNTKKAPAEKKVAATPPKAAKAVSAAKAKAKAKAGGRGRGRGRGRA